MKIEYPPTYVRDVGNYGKARTYLIYHALDQFYWLNLFLDKNINEQVILFNRTILKIFHNFVTNKVILCNHRDPLWMKDSLKYLRKNKTKFQKRNESNTVNHVILTAVILEGSNAISFFKANKYHERLAIKLNDPKQFQKPIGQI